MCISKVKADERILSAGQCMGILSFFMVSATLLLYLTMNIPLAVKLTVIGAFSFCTPIQPVDMTEILLNTIKKIKYLCKSKGRKRK